VVADRVRFELFSNASQPPPPSPRSSDEPAEVSPLPPPSSSKPPHLRRNAAGVQLLSPHLQSQIFPGDPPPGPPQSVIDISLKHLADNELYPEGAAVLPEINFDLPPLQGKNIRDHFYKLGEEAAQPYLGLARKFAENPIPDMPTTWNADGPGWIRYNSDGSVTPVEDLGGEEMICFDVEVLYKISPFPVMATAATPRHWYSWLSPSIFEADRSADEPISADTGPPQQESRKDIPRDLIPFTKSQSSEPALVVGHNVGFDRARVKDEYHVELTNNRWLDTLSLHVATKGITSTQRPVWMKRKKELKQEKEIGEETEHLIRESGDSPSAVIDAEPEVAEQKRWEDVTSSNSLAEVYRLHYGGKMDKTVRSRFGDESIKSASQLRPELQTLLEYCAEDVRVTHAVLQKTLPLFLASCPHPASFAGALGMGNPFLPINKAWKEYIQRAEMKYRQLEGGIKGILWELAYRLKERGHVPGDPWSEQLDWTLKAPRWNDDEVRGSYMKEEGKAGIQASPAESASGGKSDDVDAEAPAEPKAQEGQVIPPMPTEPEALETEAVKEVTSSSEPPTSSAAEVPPAGSSKSESPVENEIASDDESFRFLPGHESIPRWLKESETMLKILPTNALWDPLPLITRVTFHGFPVVESAEHRWIVQVPKTESHTLAEHKLEGPLTLSRPKEDKVLVEQSEDYDFFKLGLSGSPRVSSVYSKRIKKLWTSGVLASAYPELTSELSRSVDRIHLQAEIQKAVKDLVETGRDTTWARSLTWDLVDRPARTALAMSPSGSRPLPPSPKSARSSKSTSTKKMIDQSTMWPKWFHDLAPLPSKGLPVGELDLTVKKRVVPTLLRLSWKGFPLYHAPSTGWVFRVPKSEVEKNRHLIKTEVTDSKFQNDLDGVYCKLPHASGDEANVGNPLSKNFMRYVESGDLASSVATRPGDDQIASAAADAVSMNAQCSYWISARERIMAQMDVYHQDVGGLGLPAEQEKAEDLGMILPQVLTMGTVTRRAMESTWLTASNAKKNRVGSEVKAMIRAPPGYAIVGADVDSEELWIASVMGDAQFAMHGASAIGWMTLEGTKSAGTDLHSKTAKILKTKRDNAKVFNYSRIYGAGMKHAVQLLLQNDPTLNSLQAEELAQALYQSTKGVKTFTQNAYNKRARKLTGPRSIWHGGSESYLFNMLESIASSPTPRTPALGCGVTDALRKKYLSEGRSGQGDYLPSRINWVVQSSGVDYLHLLIVSMDYLIRRYSINARYMISVHDELRYMVKEDDKYRAALALQIANIWTRALFCYNLGINDLPQGVAFFSLVDIDNVFRKEVDMTCVTPSQPEPLPPGESIDIMSLLDLTQGKLGEGKAINLEHPGAPSAEQTNFFGDLSSKDHLAYLEAQASRGTSGALAYLASKNNLSIRRDHDRDDWTERHPGVDLNAVYAEVKAKTIPKGRKQPANPSVTDRTKPATKKKNTAALNDQQSTAEHRGAPAPGSTHEEEEPKRATG
jgi:DNA polymerase gamma 1